MGKIYQYDIGKELRLDTGIDITDATVVKIYRQINGSSWDEWAAEKDVGDGSKNETSGKTILKYITQNGDLDTAGTYTVVAYVEFGSSSIHYGEPASFIVLPAVVEQPS